MSFLIDILTVLLVLVSLFLILVVLMQKSKDGGMGSALGGSATESAFGHETGNVLTKMTINAAVLFFVLSIGLYLARLNEHKHRQSGGFVLPSSPAAASPDSLQPKTLAAPSPTPTASTSATTTPAAITLPEMKLPPPVEPTTTDGTAKPADAPKPVNP